MDGDERSGCFPIKCISTATYVHSHTVTRQPLHHNNNSRDDPASSIPIDRVSGVQAIPGAPGIPHSIHSPACLLSFPPDSEFGTEKDCFFLRPFPPELDPTPTNAETSVPLLPPSRRDQTWMVPSAGILGSLMSQISKNRAVT